MHLRCHRQSNDHQNRVSHDLLAFQSDRRITFVYAALLLPGHRDFTETAEY